MALAWKASWVHALTGSNPVSSATLTGATLKRTLPAGAGDLGIVVAMGIVGLSRVGPEPTYRTSCARRIRQRRPSLKRAADLSSSPASRA